MNVHIFVEGPTELAALPLVFSRLYTSGRVRTPLVIKGTRFLHEIGWRAATLLRRRPEDHVFACPDLAPREAYQRTPLHYQDYDGLQAVLRTQVAGGLRAALSSRRVVAALARFHPYPFRHDFEVLLLALPERLMAYLGTRADITKHYNALHPEDQDFERYPKRVVNGLFRKFLGRSYDATDDARRFFASATAVDLDKVRSICPCFAALVAALDRLIRA